MLPLHAQQVVKLGRYQFVPEQNVKRAVRGGGSRLLPLGAAAEGRHSVLMQFAESLTASQRALLQQGGVQLADYLGSNAYFATVEQGFAPAKVQGSGLTSVVPIRGEWKVDPRLEDWQIPVYAQRGKSMARVQLLHFASVTTQWAEKALAAYGVDNVQGALRFRLITADMPRESLRKVAELPWVVALTLIPAPQEVNNDQGRAMGKANLLALSAQLGGRALTGQGVHVGVWDGNVLPHFDYAARLHQQEFELSVAESEGHGMHVVGSIAGAGLLDPKMQGVAPGVQLYTYNFNKQTNGLNEPEEMLNAMVDFDVFLSSHSYGPSLRNLCKYKELLAYNTVTNDLLIDYLASHIPTITQVYAAGNENGECGLSYGTVNRKAKNVIHVGALDAKGHVARFSSRGPLDDGRVAPTISMKGQDVHSTMPGDTYNTMSGTSMATPLVSGHLALISERYHQLHPGQEPEEAFLRALIIATADDVNAPGPDYSYGYGILNADAAMTALEKGYFRGGTLHQGDQPATFSVPVPRGAKRAWISIAWTDTISAKQYAFGDAALINDLNLTVANGGNTYLPWVLDKDNPKADPVRKVDNLNNAELVSIDNPAGELEIAIQVQNIASSKQDYYVTWYFDMDNPRITYPAGGELLQPGETIPIESMDLHAPIRAEISYDNGVHFVPFATLDGSYSVVTLPQDAPITSKALLRLVDANGRVVVS